MRVPPKSHAAAAALYAALAVVLTWPLLLNLGTAVTDPGDPFITTWILDWDWYATRHQPLRLFDANIFHPARLTLAMSEHLYGIAMLLFPLRAVGVSALAAHNVALLAGFAFCGVGMYLLALRLTSSWIAAFTAGLFYAFVPFRFAHLPHLQHVWGGWLPLLILGLLLYAEKPTGRRAALFGALFLMNGLTNVHYFLFGALTAAIVALLLIPREQWRLLALATLAAMILLAPFLHPYVAVAKLYGMQRGEAEVYSYSAMLSDWIKPGNRGELLLFPGYAALLAGAGALVFARREKAKIALALLLIAIGVLGSLGLHFEFHRFLFGAVPGFRAIRAPARWAVIAYLGLAVLTALFTAVVARRQRWAGLLVALLFAASLWVPPRRWFLVDPEPAPVHRWLATQERMPLLELPIGVLASEYEAMLHSTVHHQPMVNGLSGFALPDHTAIAAMANSVPIPDALIDALRENGVEAVVVHADKLLDRSGPTRDWLRRELDRGRLSFVRAFPTRLDGDWVFSLKPTSGSRPAALETFLGGGHPCLGGIRGEMNFPQPGFRFVNGDAIFSGWATSPKGIRAVDLWFDNRTVLHRANLLKEKPVTHPCPGQSGSVFVAVFDERPPVIEPDTDVQVEILDSEGESALLEQRWIRWE